MPSLRAEAEKGDLESQFQLGRALGLGSPGLATNYVETVKWYRKAAEQIDTAARNHLGARYARGRGVAKDYVEAHKGWLLAAGQGSDLVPAVEPLCDAPVQFISPAAIPVSISMIPTGLDCARNLSRWPPCSSR